MRSTDFLSPLGTADFHAWFALYHGSLYVFHIAFTKSWTSECQSSLKGEVSIFLCLTH